MALGNCERMQDCCDKIWTEARRYFRLNPGWAPVTLYVFDKEFDLGALQRIAMATIHFEGHFADTLQKSQKGRPFMQDHLWTSNTKHNPALVNVSRAEVFRRIQATSSIAELTALVSPRQPLVHHYVMFGYRNDGRDGLCLNWLANFQDGLSARRKITIAMQFLTAARKCPSVQLLHRFPATTPGFLKFINHPVWVKEGRDYWCLSRR